MIGHGADPTAMDQAAPAEQQQPQQQEPQQEEEAPPAAAAAEPEKPVVHTLWPHTVLGGLQKLACQQRLYGVIERHLGHAGTGEDYLQLARMIMGRHDAALFALRRLANDDGDAAAKGMLEADAGLAAARAAAAAIVEGQLEAPAATVADFEAALGAVGGILAAVSRGDDADDDADEIAEWSLPPRLYVEACDIVHAALTADLVTAIQRGAHQLAVDEQLERERAAAAAKQQAAADAAAKAKRTRKGLLISDEDRYQLRQLERIGAADLLREQLPSDDDDEEARMHLEIEVAEVEPKFLRGKMARKKLTSLRVEARRAQQDAIFKQVAGSKQRQALRDAKRAIAGGGKSGVNADGSDVNTMEMAAEMQQTLAKERRELRNHRRRVAALEGGEAPGGAGGADARTTREAGGLVGTELDERMEEQGVRGKGDLPLGGKLPPWLRGRAGASGGEQGGHSGGHGGRGRDNDEREEISWGIKTDLTIAQQRARLPIAQHKQHIIDTVASQVFTVLVGETGSGKTTQLAQFLCDAGYANRGLIGCTQPRRVAATSLAERVAAEYGCRVGEEVGYTVRFLDQTSKLTKIKYLTDGMLLREALGDDTFSNYSVIILDEAHERSLNTDVLFGLVKAAALKRNGDLKIVVTSATLDIEKFCAYFGCERPLEIPGRTHPVDVEHAEAVVEDYVEETLHRVMSIHLTMPPGDVLCFLTGQDEIETVAERLNEWMASDELADAPPLIVTVIFGALPQENQSRVFEKTPAGSRKVVLATNIAETSITIDDLYYVIDCGFCKQNIYDPKSNVESLQIRPISQQQARQRMGRAGRTGPGKCYRLYTEAQFAELPPATIPEIKRTNLINVVLTLKATGVHDLLTFDFLDPPDQDALVLALEKLFYLGALDGDGVLSKIGSRMSQLPLEPTQCKTLLTAIDLGCASAVLTIVAMLSTQNVFYRPRDKQQEAELRHQRFTAPEGDQLTLLNVYDEWVASGCSADWCRDNFVQARALRDARDIRAQLERILGRRATAVAAVTGRGGGVAQQPQQQQQQQQLPPPDMAPEQRQPQYLLDRMQREQAGGGGRGGGRDYDRGGGRSGGPPVEEGGLGPEQASRDSVTVRKALTAGYFFQAAKRQMSGAYRTLVDRREVGIHPSSVLSHSKPRYVIYHELVKTSREYMRYAMAVDPRWLVELAPDFYSTPPPGKLTSEQMAERLAPKLKRHEQGNDWRISKVRHLTRRS